MVSSSPQDEKQKNLKYKLKELVIRFTYHSSHVPFGWQITSFPDSFPYTKKQKKICTWEVLFFSLRYYSNGVELVHGYMCV